MLNKKYTNQKNLKYKIELNYNKIIKIIWTFKLKSIQLNLKKISALCKTKIMN